MCSDHNPSDRNPRKGQKPAIVVSINQSMNQSINQSFNLPTVMQILIECLMLRDNLLSLSVDFLRQDIVDLVSHLFLFYFLFYFYMPACQQVNSIQHTDAVMWREQSGKLHFWCPK